MTNKAKYNNQDGIEDPFDLPGEYAGSKGMNPFDVPPGYFDALHADTMKRIELVSSLESAAGHNPFKVPEAYFDTLAGEISDRIHARNTKAPVAWISRPAPKYAMAFAAIALVILLTVRYFNPPVTPEHASGVYDTEQFEAACLAQLDEATLSEVYIEEAGENDNQNEAFENYLLDNDIDLSSISEQL